MAQSLDFDVIRVLRPSAGVAFVLLDERPVLFSETSQEIYQLNDTAAFIWCALQDGKPFSLLSDELTRLGVDSLTAPVHVQQALQSWLELGLLQVEIGDKSEIFSVVANLGKRVVKIRSVTSRLIEMLVPIFCSVDRKFEPIADIFDLVAVEREVCVFHNRICVARCSVDEMVPTVKLLITERIILKATTDVALHAACLVRHGNALLISGPPGAGKSTLTVCLMDADFEYSADDIALIDTNGLATGVSFSPTVKSGSWAKLSELRTDLSMLPIHVRADGKRVRYLSPRSVYDGTAPIRWILFIKRIPNVQTKLVPLGQLETMKRLIGSSYSEGEKLSRPAFLGLKRAIVGAKSFEIEYSDALLARSTVEELCHD